MNIWLYHGLGCMHVHSQDCDKGLLISWEEVGEGAKRFVSQDRFLARSMRKLQEGRTPLTPKLEFSQHPQLLAATGAESG